MNKNPDLSFFQIRSSTIKIFLNSDKLMTEQICALSFGNFGDIGK